ncbi:hypothetical protein HOLleu_07255 [Holothuria leucospilota]|uniref:Uncharacterized protein n=1 Tax=Holothuria leucospilota TaxID=206669 RepID=A0A9Q1HGU5_HOLLE|nr:hypothetical protein HOLleu_07255 [Holothuria leucospilota]
MSLLSELRVACLRWRDCPLVLPTSRSAFMEAKQSQSILLDNNNMEDPHPIVILGRVLSFIVRGYCCLTMEDEKLLTNLLVTYISISIIKWTSSRWDVVLDTDDAAGGYKQLPEREE